VRPFHVAAWIEDFPESKPTVKQKLAAVRMLYDFLVVRQIVPTNPAHSVRVPKYVVKKGKTPVWSREDAKLCWIQFQRILCPDCAIGRSLRRCSTASPGLARYLNSESMIIITMAHAAG
jgi:hypothetical protein